MTKTMSRIGGGVGALALALGVMTIVPTAAQAGTSCQGGSYSGHCVESTNEVVGSTVVDSVPISNTYATTATFTCSFTATVSRSIESSAGVSVGASAQILGAVSASVSVNVSETATQTASQATSAGVTVVLAPGESANCQRTYNYVQANVQEYDYSSSGASNVRDYPVTVPSSFGVTLAP